MIRFLLTKLAYLVPTFLGITIVAFGFVRVLPGDPVLLMAGERGLSPERHAEVAGALAAARATAQAGDRILVFGSFHTASAALDALRSDG